MENWPENISLSDTFFFSLEFIKIPSPGLELGPCNPQKIPAGLLSLVLCPVRLKYPKLQSKSVRPESPRGDGFSSWICSGDAEPGASGDPRVPPVEPGLVAYPKTVCISAHRRLLQLLSKMDFLSLLLHSFQSSCGVQEASILCHVPKMFGSVSLKLGISS